MKYCILLSAFALTAISNVANASSCESFPVAGKYVNILDSGKGQVQISSTSDCQKITVSGNDGNDWIIDLSGKSTTMPSKFAQMVGEDVADVVYSAQMIYPNHIHITARGNVTLLKTASALTINTQFEYQGDAYVIAQGSSRGKIQLEAQSVRLLSVSSRSNGVIHGETSGFIQGANIILGIAKNMLDARLLPL